MTAPPGFVTDGASIPRALWTVVGSPFTGQYVGAAVIHDVGCDTHKYSWQITHRMFYSAMRALGVSDDYAKLLYWGVRLGGPKWKEETFEAASIAKLKEKAESASGKRLNRSQIGDVSHAIGPPTYIAVVPVPVRTVHPLSPEDVASILDYIRRRAPSAPGAVSLDEIDRFTPLQGPLPANAIPPAR